MKNPIKGPLRRRFKRVEYILNDITPKGFHGRATLIWYTRSKGSVYIGNMRIFEFNSHEELVEWMESQASSTLPK